MSKQQQDVTTLVPAPSPAPAGQELTGEEILAFDAPGAVAVTVDPTEPSDPAEPAQSAEPVGSAVEVVDEPEAPVAPMPPMPAAVLPENLIDTTCPNCGHVGQVDFARREATGFCATCDYPLFWSRDRVVLPSNGAQDESGLRRLPGTAGRAALASLLCPVCREPNPATGVNCVRCGSLLHPVAAPVPVAVVPEPEPEPEPVVEQRSWLPYIIAGALAVVALIAVLVVLYR